MNKRFPVKFFLVAHYVATAVIITSVVGEKILNWTSDSDIDLDMALNSVDDQFIGCEDRMYKLVNDTILPQELKINKKFSEAWENYTNISNNFERIIKVYTYAPNQLYHQLNINVSKSRNNYTKDFNYKAFHFLLTHAIQIHRLKECTDVFRRTSVTFNKNVLDHEMRFGRFASTSFNKNMTNKFGSASCFKIKTCFGADISRMSVFPEEEEVLIPPFEKFSITTIEYNQMNCTVLYTLQSAGNLSNMNCVLFN